MYHGRIIYNSKQDLGAMAAELSGFDRLIAVFCDYTPG
jgi:hypothetical protein